MSTDRDTDTGGNMDTKVAKGMKVTKGSEFDPLSYRVLGLAIEVHRHIGPGMMESVYESCLCHELEMAEIAYERQVEVAVAYKGLCLPRAYRIDVLVEDQLVLELKSVSEVSETHSAQILSYMKLVEKPVGLLLNFNEAVLKRGVRRYVL